jgi:hypothetical protein
MDSALRLAPGEMVAGRDFTDPARTNADLVALVAIRRSLAERLRSSSNGGGWFESGESHWLVVPDRDAVAHAQPAVGVGFFGSAREHVDHTPIHRLEQELLSRAATFPGLLAYHNVRFANGQWGNLVLFANEESPSRVREDAAHLEALARTPAHYRSIRLHRLHFPDGALGEAPATLLWTLLIDLGETPPWRAIRSA